MPTPHPQTDFIASTLRREIGSELNRIIDLPDPASHAERIITSGAGADYDRLSRPFREAGSSYARTCPYDWIEQAMTHQVSVLVQNYGHGWRSRVGQVEQLMLLLARPKADGLAAAQKRIARDGEAMQVPRPAKTATPPSRRIGRSTPLDPRKTYIAQVKDGSRKARDICNLLDTKMEKAVPIRKKQWEPLPSWVKLGNGKRSWAELYAHNGTRQLVRTYINKIPRLKTRANSSS